MRVEGEVWVEYGVWGTCEGVRVEGGGRGVRVECEV